MPGQVVICGSMSNYGDMKRCCEELRALGVPCVVPEPDDEGLAMGLVERTRLKRELSRRYLEFIKNDSTFAVLVVNTPKRGVPAYIGANSFAEIAVAFSVDKRIYLYDEVFEQYGDELLAWGAVPLGADLRRLIDDYRHANGEVYEDSTRVGPIEESLNFAAQCY